MLDKFLAPCYNMSCSEREWRNRQTRTFEGRVFSTYGFKSRLSHHAVTVILIQCNCDSDFFIFCWYTRDWGEPGVQCGRRGRVSGTVSDGLAAVKNNIAQSFTEKVAFFVPMVALKSFAPAPIFPWKCDHFLCTCNHIPLRLQPFPLRYTQTCLRICLLFFSDQCQ